MLFILAAALYSMFLSHIVRLIGYKVAYVLYPAIFGASFYAWQEVMNWPGWQNEGFLRYVIGISCAAIIGIIIGWFMDE